ncbi:hypothetical protein MRS44_018514 [Fusarium solani]|uniref:uncharacterized protein n=1 Tax=Fusarium solani TaxID=169388 RepID=UPI0032C3DAA4|nr:hypothetical protein MRS44_018514 [Fusarium solani]
MDMPRSVTLLDLPREMQDEILTLLDTKSFSALVRSCTAFQVLLPRRLRPEEVRLLRLLSIGATDETIISMFESRFPATKKLNDTQQMLAWQADAGLNDTQQRLAWHPDTGFEVIKISPIQLVASSGRNKLLKYLLDRGISVDYGADRTLLTSAILANQTKTVTLLMERGASINFRDGVGPPHLAASAGSIELVDILMARPDINTHAEYGRSPVVSYALTSPSTNWREVVARLEEKGFKPTDTDLTYIINKDRGNRICELYTKSDTSTGTKTATDQGKVKENISVFKQLLSERREVVMAALIEKWCGPGVDCNFEAADSCLTMAKEDSPEWPNRLISRQVTRSIQLLAIDLESSLRLDKVLDKFPQIFSVIHVLKKHLTEEEWELDDRLCLLVLYRELLARKYPLSRDGCCQLLQSYPTKVQRKLVAQFDENGPCYKWEDSGLKLRARRRRGQRTGARRQ